MLRASAKTADGPVLVAGITDENVARLKAGMPIRATLRSFGVDQPGTLTIVHGATHAALEDMLRGHGLVTADTRTTVDPRLDQMEEAQRRHDRILICTVGLPRSGKTTWAKSQAYPIVCPDAIRLAMHGQRFQALAEPFVWATAKVMVRALFLAGHKTVILDATNTMRKRREEWVSSEWATFFKQIDTDSSTCRQRAALEKDDEIGPVIDRMEKQFEPLGDDERRWV